MASRAHDFIVQMIGIVMKERGYKIISTDADSSKISDLNFKTPPTLKRHRPDMLGIQEKTDKICIGEAKTDSDLLSGRSLEQFEDFSNIIVNSNDKAELIIGIPLSSEKKLDQILRKLNLSENRNVYILKIPDGLLPK